MPLLVLLLITLCTVGARAELALLVPTMSLIYVARIGAAADVFVVPRARLRQTPLWRVFGF